MHKQHMNSFTYKGYGRIYTDPEYIQVVECIIQELDGYYPLGLVTYWDNYPNVLFIGKFELYDCEKLKELCKERNIPVFIFDSGFDDSPLGYYPSEPLNREEIKQLSY